MAIEAQDYIRTRFPAQENGKKEENRKGEKETDATVMERQRLRIFTHAPKRCGMILIRINWSSGTTMMPGGKEHCS